MRRRVLTSILAVAAIAIVLFGVPLAIVVERFVDDDAALRVERAAVLASRQVPADFANGLDPVELPENDDEIVLGLYDLTGARVAGAGPVSADAPTKEARANRVVDATASSARIVAVPVAADERVVGVIRAEQSTAKSDERTRTILLLLSALALGVLSVGAGIGYVLAGRLARPVRRLRDAAVRLGDGDFSIDLPHSGVPELDQAGEAMTATATRLDDLITRERSFSADASHQLRTPLAGLRASIETELEFPRPDPSIVLTEALTDIDRLERTVTELLLISRTSVVGRSAISFDEVFTDLDSVWRARIERAGRVFSIAPGRFAPTVSGNAAMLRHALDVLLDNALRHGRGMITLGLTVAEESVTISVTDEGLGFVDWVDSNDRQESSDGLHGMGLPLVRRLVDAMPGRLTVARSGPSPRIEILLQRRSSG